MSDPNFFIESERLYLSYLLPDNDAHCDFLVKLWNTPEFIASIGGKPTSVTTREAARQQLAGRFQAEHARNGYGTYLVGLKPETAAVAPPAGGTPIGTVSLMRGEPPNCYTAPDIGFAILPEYMRRGLATEAAQTLMDYVEREKGVKDVLGLCDPNNEGSKAVFRRLGFEDRGQKVLKIFGGITGQAFAKPGMDQDLGVYGL
ncbi:acyl-CoA N-acyltransferase [Cryphonectria parasitica EP155]|uniref:Acyl-CoA N-acyltransferase n=1 Tax=Cryphonectria parasitica (strain ATCC 38755 / EP155) TaxID=660469 RepID=A0A9P4XVR3_CRYP1|nr:acyl-CoA N-acyltransferase [Cryphonectria parasitica EP155]KAF3761726.1 acyl-CoA N-acyltransferase [Cryphonectria parasitica EP155]